MALIECGECGAEVSDKAGACVKCGAPIAVHPEAVEVDENGYPVKAGARAGRSNVEPKNYGCGSLIFAGFVLMFVWAMLEPYFVDKPVVKRNTAAISDFREIVGNGYRVTGRSGVMVLVAVAVDVAQQGNEDVYRTAVGDICARKSICQVLFWVGNAPQSFPLTDNQVDLKLVQWQQNLNTGLRRWVVKCNSSNLFESERECM